GVTVRLVETIAAHVTPVGEECGRCDHVGPLVACESRVIVVGAAGEAEGVRVAALYRLDPRDFISAEDRVQQAAAVHKFPALAYRKLIDRIRDQAVIPVVAGPSLLQPSVLNGCDARTVIIVILAVDCLGERIKRTERQTVRNPLVNLNGASMIGGASEVGPGVDVAIVRVGPEVLLSGQYLVLQRWVSTAEVDGKGVDVPALQERNSRGSLVRSFDQVVR